MNLSTRDLDIGKKIAGALHEKKGGLAGVRAMAAEISKMDTVQIGMSVYDYEKTLLYRICEMIKLEAQRHNLSIISSEFNGMTPIETILYVARYYIRAANLNDDRIVETAICKKLQIE